MAIDWFKKCTWIYQRPTDSLTALVLSSWQWFTSRKKPAETRRKRLLQEGIAVIRIWTHGNLELSFATMCYMYFFYCISNVFRHVFKSIWSGTQARLHLTSQWRATVWGAMACHGLTAWHSAERQITVAFSRMTWGAWYCVLWYFLCPL